MEMNKKKTSEEEKIILDQWKTCVEMANCTSQRRDTMNNIFVTLNLALITAVAFVWDIKSFFILFAGIVICVIWMFFIRNYKLLNTAKFEVINELEERLPTAPFNDEWEKLKKIKKYHDGTKLERILPITFICLYILVSAVILIMKYIH